MNNVASADRGQTAVGRLALLASSPRRNGALAPCPPVGLCADPAGAVLDAAQIYPEFAPLVSRLIRQYGDTPQMREDLVGEIYCRFAAFVSAYEPSRGIPLRAYLVDQLTLSVFNWARGRRRDRNRETSLEAQPDTITSARAGDPTSDWDHALQTEAIRAALSMAIEALPTRQRRVVILRYYEERSFEEIARIMGIREATARSLLRNGLNNLRQWVAECGLEWSQR